MSLRSKFDPTAARFRPGNARGHYESWFLRGNDPTRPRAFWIRYTVTSPAGRPGDAIAELFLACFDGETGRHMALRELRPVADGTFAPAGLDVRIGSSSLVLGRAVGAIESGGGDARWDLSFGDGQAPLLHFPLPLYYGPFPKAKSLVSNPGVDWSGVIHVGGERLDVTGWRGSLNHSGGARQTDFYYWGQVVGFEGLPDTLLEVATARVKLGRYTTPLLTPVVLRHRGIEYRLNVPWKLTGRAETRGLDWHFHAKNRAVSLTGHISCTARDVVTFAYLNPSGGTKLCVNSKIARCVLTVETGGLRETLTSPSGAAFEVLVDHPEQAQLADLPTVVA